MKLKTINLPWITWRDRVVKIKLYQLCRRIQSGVRWFLTSWSRILGLPHHILEQNYSWRILIEAVGLLLPHLQGSELSFGTRAVIRGDV